MVEIRKRFYNKNGRVLMMAINVDLDCFSLTSKEKKVLLKMAWERMCEIAKDKQVTPYNPMGRYLFLKKSIDKIDIID